MSSKMMVEKLSKKNRPISVSRSCCSLTPTRSCCAQRRVVQHKSATSLRFIPVASPQYPQSTTPQLGDPIYPPSRRPLLGGHPTGRPGRSPPLLAARQLVRDGNTQSPDGRFVR